MSFDKAKACTHTNRGKIFRAAGATLAFLLMAVAFPPSPSARAQLPPLPGPPALPDAPAFPTDFTTVDRLLECLSTVLTKGVLGLRVERVVDYCTGIDSDSDGLTDAYEDDLQGTAELPLLRLASDDPDGDDDGLADGLEMHLKAPMSIRPPELGGTKLTQPLKCGPAEIDMGRPTFQPAAQDPNALDLDPSKKDTDADGIIDGLEDLNFDGAATGDALIAHDPDTDDDQLSDGLELRLFGAYDFCTRSADNRRLTDDPRIFQYTAVDRPNLETDPALPDTDGDGIKDGLDVNPNKMHPPAVGVHLRSFMLHADAWPDGRLEWERRLDPYVRFEAKTPIGDFVVRTPRPGCDVNFEGFKDAQGLLSGNDPGSPTIPGGAGSKVLMQVASFDSYIWLILSNDIADWNLRIESNRLTIDATLAVYDQDGWLGTSGACDGLEADLSGDDVMDINRAAGQDTQNFGGPIGIENTFPCGRATELREGGWDAGGSGSDNAHLSGRLVDTISGELVFRALQVRGKAGGAPLLPGEMSSQLPSRSLGDTDSCNILPGPPKIVQDQG